MSLPLIGLTTYNQTNKYNFPISALMHRYIQATAEAGCVPILIPTGLTENALNTLFERLDGILFTGGGDIAIEYFDGAPHPRVDGVDAERDATELFLAKNAAVQGKPFLGICRGIQLVNVALGGTLYTDIADQLPGAIKHDYDSGTQRELLAHEVKVDEGSHLAAILDEQVLKVNSLHHQGAKDVAAMLKPVAFSPDGLVEAVELLDHPFGIAVQWHPEWLTGQPVTRRLFRAFVEAASNHR
jgi:putative glutamine amidotransferase